MTKDEYIKEWYNKYSKKILKRLKKRLNRIEDAEDILQNIAINLLTSTKEWDQISATKQTDWHYLEYKRKLMSIKRWSEFSLTGKIDEEFVIYETSEDIAFKKELRLLIHDEIESIQQSYGTRTNNNKKIVQEILINDVDSDVLAEQLQMNKQSVQNAFNKTFKLICNNILEKIS